MTADRIAEQEQADLDFVKWLEEKLRDAEFTNSQVPFLAQRLFMRIPPALRENPEHDFFNFDNAVDDVAQYHQGSKSAARTRICVRRGIELLFNKCFDKTPAAAYRILPPATFKTPEWDDIVTSLQHQKRLGLQTRSGDYLLFGPLRGLKISSLKKWLGKRHIKNLPEGITDFKSVMAFLPKAKTLSEKFQNTNIAITDVKLAVAFYWTATHPSPPNYNSTEPIPYGKLKGLNISWAQLNKALEQEALITNKPSTIKSLENIRDHLNVTNALAKNRSRSTPLDAQDVVEQINGYQTVDDMQAGFQKVCGMSYEDCIALYQDNYTPVGP